MIGPLEIDDEEEQEQNSETLVEDQEKEKVPPLKYKFLIYLIPIIILVLVIIGLIIITSLPDASDNEDDIEKPKKGIIKLRYQIQTRDLNTNPISDKYQYNDDFEFYVGGLKFSSYKKFKFTTTGTRDIELVLNTNKINMANMFNNITTLRKVEMNSTSLDENISIIAMENTFENCKSLTSISLSGFNTDLVTNMSKLFYNTGLTSIDLGMFNYSNVIDMTYMFANCESLKQIDLSNLDLNNVIDMSYSFSSCTSLTDVNMNEQCTF